MPINEWNGLIRVAWVSGRLLAYIYVVLQLCDLELLLYLDKSSCSVVIIELVPRDC